jgi:hypothetical protein
MTLDETTAGVLGNNLIRCGALLLKRATPGDERVLESIAATLAQAQQVLEKACGRVVLAPPRGEAVAAPGPCPALLDGEVS